MMELVLTVVILFSLLLILLVGILIGAMAAFVKILRSMFNAFLRIFDVF